MGKSSVGACLALTGALLLTTAAGQSTKRPVEEYPAPLVRERQSVEIGGVTEQWELRWKAPPKPACEPSEVSLTCPCTDFAYGEGGDLTLVRIRGGQEIDRLNLTSLFKGADVNLGDIAILQRWTPDPDKDFQAVQQAGFEKIVARRPVVRIMDFADYDHDGQRSEFYLKTDTLPCGKSVGVVVGVSVSRQRLHVFGTASKPAEPLVLQKKIWQALSGASGPIDVVDWQCGDHGADEETSLRLHWTSKGIDGVRRSYSCPRGPKQRAKTEEPL